MHENIMKQKSIQLFLEIGVCVSDSHIGLKFTIEIEIMQTKYIKLNSLIKYKWKFFLEK